MRQPPETIRTIQLDYDQVWVFDAGRDARVRVLHGATWLTGEGRLADTILRAGDECHAGRGRTVVEALEPACVEVVSADVGGVLAAWMRAAGRAGAALRRAIARTQLGPAAVGR